MIKIPTELTKQLENFVNNFIRVQKYHSIDIEFTSLEKNKRLFLFSLPAYSGCVSSTFFCQNLDAIVCRIIDSDILYVLEMYYPFDNDLMAESEDLIVCAWQFLDLIESKKLCDCLYVLLLQGDVDWDMDGQRWRVNLLNMTIQYCLSCGIKIPLLGDVHQSLNRFEALVDSLK